MTCISYFSWRYGSKCERSSLKLVPVISPSEPPGPRIIPVTSRDVLIGKPRAGHISYRLIGSIGSLTTLPHHIYHEFISACHDETLSPFHWWRSPVLQFVGALLTRSYRWGKCWTSHIGYFRERAACHPCGHGCSLEEEVCT